ncbi:Tigger transposable element-derived protein 4 [Frankliniella fusca]|uniref:Tigger transposable element-derived protein 4 n=1 Tax=Frankliniella fusca TaxID=407009 RepID=A0AAE1HBK1_9NEOP|nr:Tigger transposable element-derived protein 4 [Frankliniella fusca]KAK3917536.1 Tigger transposable element-derived protein 4 [Frankliniella fusca]KAK3918132.1 Tigger transposable element-derived protein 4 [Frankliniella fusca]
MPPKPNIPGVQRPKNKASYNLTAKLKFIQEVKNSPGESRSSIASRLGVPVTTLNSIYQAREKIEESAVEGNAKRSKMKTSKYAAIDNALKHFILQARSLPRKIPLSGTHLKAKAKLIATRLGIEGFTASDGWLDRFKKRNRVNYLRVSGECADVSAETVASWTTSVLPWHLKGCELRDVYNIDELGLFINLLPDKSMNCTSKLQPMDMGIIRKLKHYYRARLVQRLINFIGMANVEKKDFFYQYVPGSSLYSVCMASSHSYNNSELLQKGWLPEGRRGRGHSCTSRISCGDRHSAWACWTTPEEESDQSDPDGDLSEIESTTDEESADEESADEDSQGSQGNANVDAEAVQENADAGVDAEVQEESADGNDMEVDFVDADAVGNYVEVVEAEIHFFDDEEEMDEIPLDESVRERWEEVCQMLGVDKQIPFSAYVDADKDLAVCEELTAEQFADMERMPEDAVECTDRDSDDGDDEEPPTPVTAMEIMQSLDTVRRYFAQHEDADEDTFQLISKLEKLMILKKKKQTKISNFFKPFKEL